MFGPVRKVKIRLPQLRPHNGDKSPGLAYDCDIAARIRQGDRAALKQLIERHTGRVHRYLVHRLGDGNDDIIDRVLAATFTTALRRIGPYANSTASTPMELWLIHIAERKLAGMKTANRPITQHPTDLDRLRAALATLPNRHGFVLSLALFEQMPAAPIAQTLGLSPAAGMRRLRAALKRVGHALEKQEVRD